MPIAPRFQRVAALQRPFVDREHVLADFAAELGRIGGGPRVFNVTGIGGIGKSRLLRELQDRASARFRTAAIDLQVPALRRQEDALAVLRGQLGAQGADFDRFDIAYAVLWQRLHPHLRLTGAELPFGEYSSILSDILDGVSGLPIFGTAVGIAKLLDRGTTGVHRRVRIRRDPTLQALDGLPNGELSDAVTYLFAEDLRAASASKQAVVIVDTYEALVPAPAYTGRVQLADAWLRDLAGQLDRALVVIASREPLHWEMHDPDWAQLISTCAVSGLPMAARLELLQAGGISAPADRQLIAAASAGLPFYLHLAVDTHQHTGGGVGPALVSPGEILARFLQYVAPEEIRLLEILSPARIFDYELFRGLAAAFQLPSTRLAWDSLTAYSFIYPAGDALRLHQLIRAAVQARLPATTVTQIHTQLRTLWAGRAAGGGGSAAARAYREAAYHALRAGQVTAAGLLGYADHAVRQGGHSAAAGIADDLDQWLAGQPATADTSEAALAARCLRAEAAVRVGDAAGAAALTRGAPATAEPDSEVTARLAVAAGHGERIAGNTAAALTAFTRVWERGHGPARLAAGLWAGDLHMCQGRFRDAEDLTAELEALTPAGEHEFRGDIARLRHLTHRFAFDFAAAFRYLGDATASYRAAGSALGLANAHTNRAELLALTDPAAAITEAARAIEVQREIGAHHELGKAYTALAIAHMTRGELDQADAAFRSACSALERARYRSGRARAEFYQAIAHARRGRTDEARSSLRWATAELQAAGVYPTLILCASRVLAALGITDDAVAAAARAAAGQLQPLGTAAGLEAKTGAFVAGLLGPGTRTPASLYQQAADRTGRAAGFYNNNVKLTPPAGPVIVRMPIPRADVMDLAIWPEPAVLRAIRGLVTCAPRLLWAQDQPRFQVHEFIDGDQLDTAAPRGVPVPGHVIGDVAALFRQLGTVPRERIPPLPGGWPAEGDTGQFARRLSAITDAVFRRFRPEFGGLFAALGVPADPLTAVLARWAALQPRPFRLLHTDIHRKNIIVAAGQAYFLDWELALWGDPVYDLAVHLHKMGYLPAEGQAMRHAWLAAVPGAASAGWEPDLDTYLAHERVKSAIVDTVRYTKIIVSEPDAVKTHAELAAKLVGKLAAAHATGGDWAARKPPTPKEIAAHIQDWAAKHAP
jgi:tetratricopeptide (TPR) repeat protein